MYGFHRCQKSLSVSVYLTVSSSYLRNYTGDMCVSSISVESVCVWVSSMSVESVCVCVSDC